MLLARSKHNFSHGKTRFLFFLGAMCERISFFLRTGDADESQTVDDCAVHG